MSVEWGEERKNATAYVVYSTPPTVQVDATIVHPTNTTATESEQIVEKQQQHDEPPKAPLPSSISDKKPPQPSAPSFSYTPPTWASKPTVPFSLEVLKDGTIASTIDISQKDQ